MWASNGNWLYLVCSFPSVNGPSCGRGEEHSLCLDNVPDILHRYDSGGPRPVASWSHCEGDQWMGSFRVNSSISICCQQLEPANAFKTMFLLLSLLATLN